MHPAAAPSRDLLSGTYHYDPFRCKRAEQLHRTSNMYVVRRPLFWVSFVGYGMKVCSRGMREKLLIEGVIVRLDDVARQTRLLPCVSSLVGRERRVVVPSYYITFIFEAHQVLLLSIVWTVKKQFESDPTPPPTRPKTQCGGTR